MKSVITTFNDSPRGICGTCPAYGATLRNPPYGEKRSSQPRWEVTCSGCGAQRVMVENGRMLQKLGLIAPENAARDGIADRPRETTSRKRASGSA